MGNRDAYPDTEQSTGQGTEQEYNDKLKKALKNLGRMNASFIEMEEKLARQNARCRQVSRDMKKLQQSLIQSTATARKSSH